MEKTQAIIFDLDGTLLNTLDDLADSMNRVLFGMGFPVHETEKYKYFVGDGVEILARRVLPENKRKEKTISLCVEKMLIDYGRNCQQKTTLYDGIADLLSALVARDIKLTILSNKPDHLTKKAQSFFLKEWPFDVVSGVKPDVPKKPDPSGALRIAEKLCIPLENFLYVGDTGTDMVTARKAGIFSLGALWGFRNSSELIENGAQALLERPLEVLNYI